MCKPRFSFQALIGIALICLTALIAGCSQEATETNSSRTVSASESSAPRTCDFEPFDLGPQTHVDGAIVSSRYHRYWAVIDTHASDDHSSVFMHCLKVYKRSNPDTTAHLRADSTNVATLWALAPDYDEQIASHNRNPERPTLDTLLYEQIVILDTAHVPLHSFGRNSVGLKRRGFIGWRRNDDSPALHVEFAGQSIRIAPNALMPEARVGLQQVPLNRSTHPDSLS